MRVGETPEHPILMPHDGEWIMIGHWRQAEPHLRVLDKAISLPQCLAEMTNNQVAETVKYLAGKPLKTLRRWQDIIESQIGPSNSMQAASNLMIMQRHLAAAVDLREFPDDPTPS